MKKTTFLSVIGLILLFGCASIETPFQVTITEFSDGNTAEEIVYPAAGSDTATYNMSRYLWAYYYAHAGGFPDDVTVISVEFDLCGYQNLASYPSNIRISYPQFGGGNALLHAGALNGCVHIANDSGLLDPLLTMDSNPLECCERSYVDKVEMRYPRVHNTTEEVELVVWDNGRNITGVNYTCFGGDITRQVTGTELVERNDTNGVPSIFNFTCPQYGAEGRYIVTINQVATFDGMVYTWTATPGYYTEVVIADGGNVERFPLKMNFSSDSAGRLEIRNITIKYNNRLQYGSGPTSTITGSTPPWASSYSTIADSILEAEVDIGNESNVDHCNVTGTITDFTNCTDSLIEWSKLSNAEIENSIIKYTQTNSFNAYDSTIINGDGIVYFNAYGADYDNGMLYDGQLEIIPSEWGVVAAGVFSLPSLYGCDGAGATWVFTGIEGLGLLDINWQMSNGCALELYESIFGFGGNAAITGDPKLLLEDRSYFIIFDLTAPLKLTDAVIEMDDTSILVVYNASVTFDNTLGLAGTPRFYVADGGQLSFANNIAGAYPAVWIVDNESNSAVYFSNIDFSSYGSDFTVTDQYVLGQRFVSFDDASMQYINETNATIVMYDTGSNPQIYYYENYTDDINEIIGNGVLCDPGRCSNLRHVGRAISFDVTGLSSYAVKFSQPAVNGGNGGETKEFDVGVESGYSGESVYFETSVGRVWIEIFGSGGESVAIFRTDEYGIGEFIPDAPGAYRYEATKSGYREEDGSFTVGERVEEEPVELQEEEPTLPEEPVTVEEQPPAGEEITGEATEEPLPTEEIKENVTGEEAKIEEETEAPPEAGAEEGFPWLLFIGMLVIIALIIYFAMKLSTGKRG